MPAPGVRPVGKLSDKTPLAVLTKLHHDIVVERGQLARDLEDVQRDVQIRQAALFVADERIEDYRVAIEALKHDEVEEL